MARGLVYILKNPCMPLWVKIGMTESEDIEPRLKELNASTAVPLSFRVYATYAVDDPKTVESSIHEMINAVDDELRAREPRTETARERVREFFQMEPEKAYALFAAVAKARGDSHCLKLTETTAEQKEEDKAAEIAINNAAVRRPNFTFSMLNIPVGSVLTFVNDDTRTCIVADDKHVSYGDEQIVTLSKLASKLLHEFSGWQENVSVAGPYWFTYEGETLADRRNRLENVTIEEERDD